MTIKPIAVMCELSSGDLEGRVFRGDIPADQSRRFLADAIIDISSAFTLIPEAWARKLGLRTHAVHYPWAFGPEALQEAGAMRIGVNGHETIEHPIVRGDRIVLGLTAWTRLDFKLDEAGRIVPRHVGGQLLRI